MLEILDLSHNKFLGLIPSCSDSIPLRFLNWNGNNLTGLISNALFNSSTLEVLDIGNNHFSGDLATWAEGEIGVSVLLLEGNDFDGPTPVQLCNMQYLYLLDLPDNKFSGTIPHCFNNTVFGNAQGVNYQSAWFLLTTWLSWSVPTSVKDFYIQSEADYRYPEVEFMKSDALHQHGNNNWYSSAGMDLSGNKLTGSIPHEMGNLSAIQVLHMSNNRLTGSIPASLSNLYQIESLDLSNNKLKGSIPLELTMLHMMVAFSVAYNKLSGRIPDFQPPFSATSYEGNRRLCSPPLRRCSP